MHMTINEALSILGIRESFITKALIKSTHRRLLSKYHPDRNPSGHEKTQQINIARDFLFNQSYPIHVIGIKSSNDYSERYYSVKFVREMTITKCNAKTYVAGKTFVFKDLLKEHRFRWDPKDRRWWRESYYEIEDYLAQAEFYGS